jgi:hypothetical protein
MQGNSKIELSVTDKLLLYGTDLKLFEIKNQIPILKNIFTDFQSIKTLEWNKFEPFGEICAISSSNKINIARIKEDLEVKCEITSNGRICNALAWSKYDPSVLLAGFERSRGDSGLLFYDISVKSYISSTENLSSAPEIVAQYGSSQAVTSVCWMKNVPIANAGMGYKWIRSYDLRGKIC